MGHILEGGAPATGGLHTDWKDVPDWAHIGYPIAECRADGTFVITKPEGTGGLVTPATVAEQMLYEIGDPQGYIVPDVVCDFSTATFRQAGENRVEVANVKGYAPTATFKVCGTYRDGWRATSLTPVLGIDAPQKAQRQAEAVITRCNEMLRDRNLAPYRATRIDVIGSGATYGKDPAESASREVVVKVSVEHDDEMGMRIFTREQASPITSMSVGTTAWHGLDAKVLPIVRLFSFLIPKAEVPAVIDFNGARATFAAPQPAVFDPAEVKRPGGPDAPAEDGDMVETPLIRIAYARSGDKGDAFNVGIFPRRPEFVRVSATPLRVGVCIITRWSTTTHESGQTGARRASDRPLDGASEKTVDRPVGNRAAGGGGRPGRLPMVPTSQGPGRTHRRRPAGNLVIVGSNAA